MKCQILFSVKNKKNITNLSSAELAQRMVKVKDKFCSYREQILSCKGSIFLKHRHFIIQERFNKLIYGTY